MLACAAFGLVAAVAHASAARAVPAAAPATAFGGSASAAGVAVSYVLDDFLVVEDVTVDGPASQAVVTATESVAYAAGVYPGPTGVGAPGLASGALGAPLPDYPLIAQSSAAGAPEAIVEQPGLTLRASSTPDASSGSTRTGGSSDESGSTASSRATADVAHDPVSGTTTSASEAVTEGITIGDTLRIGRVRAAASVTSPVDGERARTSELSIEGVTVAGLPTAITADGVVTPGGTSALPGEDPVNEALQEAHIEVRYLAPEETPTGVVSAGLEIRVTREVPMAPEPGVLVYQFGRASAQATGGAGGFVATPPTVSTPDGTAGSGATRSPAPIASAPQVNASSPVAVPPSAAAAPLAPARPTSPDVTGTPISAQLVSPAFYLVLVLGAAVAFGTVQLIRLFGVRLAWNES